MHWAALAERRWARILVIQERTFRDESTGTSLNADYPEGRGIQRFLVSSSTAPVEGVSIQDIQAGRADLQGGRAQPGDDHSDPGETGSQ